MSVPGAIDEDVWCVLEGRTTRACRAIYLAAFEQIRCVAAMSRDSTNELSVIGSRPLEKLMARMKFWPWGVRKTPRTHGVGMRASKRVPVFSPVRPKTNNRLMTRVNGGAVKERGRRKECGPFSSRGDQLHISSGLVCTA